MSESINTEERDLQRANSEIEELRKQLRDALAEAGQSRAEAQRLLEQFAREVRVPLTSVLGFTDLLSVTHKGNPVELTQLAMAGHQLWDLVTNLEEFAAKFAAANAEHLATSLADDTTANVRKILHIEDNETNFRLIERILEDRANLNLSWACNGQEGLALALQQRPALILLDLNLPDTHGGELLLKFKSNQLTQHIPVIVLSADISPTQIEKMLQAGARDYLTKPFEIKRLLCLVDEALAAGAKSPGY
jgi:CheY-like chemotaxis protein